MMETGLSRLVGVISVVARSLTSNRSAWSDAWNEDFSPFKRSVQLMIDSMCVVETVDY
jgi:hypothetical protein